MHDEYSVVSLGDKDDCSESYFVPNQYSYNEGLDWFGDHETAVTIYARRILEDFFRSEDADDWKQFCTIKVAGINEQASYQNWDIVTFNVTPDFFDEITAGNTRYVDFIEDTEYETKDLF